MPDPCGLAINTLLNAVAPLKVVSDRAYAAVAVSITGDIVCVTSEIEGILGYAPTELVGQPLVTIMPPRFHDSHRRGFLNYLETGLRKLNWRDVRLPGLHRDGTERALVISFTEVHHEGSLLLCAAIRSDVVG